MRNALVFLVVGRGGFGPPKSVTADLQSAPFGRSGTCPYFWSWRLESNPQPADYKSAALPVELRQQNHLKNGALGRNRTTDRQIFSLLLYRLSYQGIFKPLISQRLCFNGDLEGARTLDL